jgi:hypothetical protein
MIAAAIPPVDRGRADFREPRQCEAELHGQAIGVHDNMNLARKPVARTALEARTVPCPSKSRTRRMRAFRHGEPLSYNAVRHVTARRQLGETKDAFP